MKLKNNFEIHENIQTEIDYLGTNSINNFEHYYDNGRNFKIVCLLNEGILKRIVNDLKNKIIEIWYGYEKMLQQFIRLENVQELILNHVLLKKF